MHLRSVLVLAALCTSAASSALPRADSIGAPSKLELGVVDVQDGIRLRERHGGEEHEDDADHPAHSDAMDHAHSGASSSSTPSASHQQASGGHQHPHGPPQAHINETLILMTHDPDPLAYWRYDQENDEAHPTLLVFHIALASLSFFALLPITIFLKGGKSPLAILSQLGFLATAILSLVFGIAYKRSTPALYEGSSHTKLGWITMIIVIALNALDVARFAVHRLSSTFGGQQEIFTDEARPLVVDEDEHFVISSPTEIADTEDGHHWTDVQMDQAAQRHREHHLHRSSTNSSDGDGTLYDTAGPSHDSSKPFGLPSVRSKLQRYAKFAERFIQTLLVVFAYVQTLSGIAIYSGSCRSAYLNGCMAHLIKGSVFVIYGLITFCRYIGAFSRYGWAWNRQPATSKAWSAEMVESFVCFFYGITNTWMERFGKHAGDPYSVKDVQHISIAVMFWFAGILGMLIESKRVRKWLSTPVVVASGLEESRISRPASYSSSFNPFPAIIVGTTGVAMAAHAQTFAFQVDVHALWGLFLGLFALFRFLTYFFLYLRPPASILPSRPPTEALAALMLTCGGVVFILSTEQVTFAAMRHGFDDIMAFLNFTVTLVSITFAWIVALFALQGWALGRHQARQQQAASLEAHVKA
ncbi:hypothetical protein BCR35DRAFT_300622 [Leucosporidium creatinivorum]|uniref:Cytoplasmic protein n=1 Tax=Leucosporidium creatinivorum TaxID=106004 RepID=A0A1Y2FZA0_9BASI|nr:hypothetical protein BCR35DRAFT_300622 [Leucosporidium creatinivorum]